MQGHDRGGGDDKELFESSISKLASTFTISGSNRIKSMEDKALSRYLLQIQLMCIRPAKGGQNDNRSRLGVADPHAQTSGIYGPRSVLGARRTL